MSDVFNFFKFSETRVSISSFFSGKKKFFHKCVKISSSHFTRYVLLCWLESLRNSRLKITSKFFPVIQMTNFVMLFFYYYKPFYSLNISFYFELVTFKWRLWPVFNCFFKTKRTGCFLIPCRQRVERVWLIFPSWNFPLVNMYPVWNDLLHLSHNSMNSINYAFTEYTGSTNKCITHCRFQWKQKVTLEPSHVCVQEHIPQKNW